MNMQSSSLTRMLRSMQFIRLSDNNSNWSLWRVSYWKSLKSTKKFEKEFERDRSQELKSSLLMLVHFTFPRTACQNNPTNEKLALYLRPGNYIYTFHKSSVTIVVSNVVVERERKAIHLSGCACLARFPRKIMFPWSKKGRSQNVWPFRGRCYLNGRREEAQAPQAYC